MRRGEAWKPLRARGGWMRLSEKAVFYALLERADNNDCSIPAYMTPSLDQLAEAVGGGTSTVCRALDHLEHHGWLTRNRSKGGRTHKTTYQLLDGFECLPDCDKRRPPSPTAGRQSATKKLFGSGTVYEEKLSDSGTPKLSHSHSQTRRSAPVSDEGIREGEGAGFAFDSISGGAACV
jgi:DNA-binding MarR family transcriptional regulator